MFIYKKLKASDVNTIAFEAHKEYNINKDNTASLGISLLDSSYSSASRDTYSVFDINNHKQYFQLDHLFYKDALFNYGNLIGGIDYNNQEKRLYDKATIISLSQKTFGSGVQKGTFLFNNTYKDDSLGNLYVKNDILSNYPQDKERVFYLAPVKGFKSVDLTRDPNTGEPIVNAATSYNDLKLDDSLYTNPVEYISCSFARNTNLNCTEVDLTNGYIKAPHSNNYNFGNEDFTISFYYKPQSTTVTRTIIAKSKSQTVVEYPESNLDGSLKNTHGSASLLQSKEVDAGRAFPFEISINGASRKLEFKRADQDTTSFITGSSLGPFGSFFHVACVKSGSKLKIYMNGAQDGADHPDNTNLCQNKADLFIGTDPTISSSKLDNTENQQISQLMIWNKALSTTEIANVSESIDGSPYVGNIFYENGIATLTSPKVNDGTLTSLQDFTGIITLDNTPYVQGAGTTTVLPQPTFSGSLTFTSSRETLEQLNSSQIFDLLSFNSTYISASLAANAIFLTSKPYALLDDYIINPIQSESFELYNSYASLNPIVDAIPGGIGTGSGDRGTDGDSITTTENILGAFKGVFLAENQTVTASFDITPISSATTIDELCYDEGGPGGDSPLTDSTLEDESRLKFGNSNDGGTIQGAVLTGGNAGEIAITGSNGFVSFFNAGGLKLPKIETNHSNQLTTDAFPAYVYFGTDSGEPQFPGVTVTGTDIPDNTFPGEGSYYTRVDAISVTNEKFVFGPAANNGTHYSKLYKAPGSIIFTIEAGVTRDADTTVNGQVQFRYKPSGGSFGAWTNVGSSVPIGVDTTLISQNHNRVSTYINNGDQYEYRIKFTKTAGFGSVTLNPSARAYISSQTQTPGFKDRVDLQTDPVNHPISLVAGDVVRYSVNTIRGFNTYNPSDHIDGDVQITKAHTKGSSNNTLSYSGTGQDDNLEDIKLWVNVYKHNYGSAPDILIDSNKLTSNQNLQKYLNVSTTGNYYIRLFLGDNSGNILYHPGSQGFSIRQILVERWEATNTYDITNYVGPGGSTYQEFGITTNTDGETFDQSISFDDNSIIQGAPVPTTIHSFSSPTEISFSTLPGTTLLITSSLGSTASFDQGNFISGSASIDITGTKGLYKVENVTLGTSTLNPIYGATQTAIGSDQKVRIQTKKNGALQDTKYINGNIVQQNAFQAEADKLDLGLLTNTDNISFEFTVVDSSNNIDKVTKTQGFNVQRIELSKLTGSNEVTQVNDGTFPDNLDALYFSSSHINTGNASMPFTTGQITASISSISVDGKTITLDNNLFITSSLTDALFHVSGAENGPFIISASYQLPTNVIGTDKEYQIEELSSNINVNDPGTGIGLGTKINIGNAFDITTTLQESFQDTGTTITNDITYRNNASSGNSFNTIKLFVSGVASSLYPDGAVTASLNYTQSIVTNVTMSAISGSNISSGDTFTVGEFAPFTGYESNLLGITSSHNDDPHAPNEPLYTQGKQDISIVERTSDGHIKVNTTLFITASSKATGSSDSSSFTPGEYTFTSENPITATGVTSDMLGGTFEFQDLGTLETSEYQITAIDGNEITLDNLTGGSNAIQTVNEANLTNTPEVTVNFSSIVANEFTIQYKNSHLIFENEFHCTVDEDEYNFSLNPTARKNKDINKGDLANFATGSNFKPYVTTVGLYNEAGELLVVGKLGQPVKMSDETDTTFVVRYDT